jgi:hypothetical protein
MGSKVHLYSYDSKHKGLPNFGSSRYPDLKNDDMAFWNKFIFERRALLREIHNSIRDRGSFVEVFTIKSFCSLY